MTNSTHNVATLPRLKPVLSAALFSALLIPSFLFSASYTIDKDHTSVGFSVKHMVVTNTKGVFNDFTGDIQFDPKKIEKSTFTGTIKVDSIDTRNTKRDDHLKSADFFSSKDYPTITFKSTKVAPSGQPNVVTVTGDLTIRNVTKSVTFPLAVTDAIKNPWGNTIRGFSTEFKINRSEYGLIWNKVLETGGLAVGEDVTISLDLEAVQN